MKGFLGFGAYTEYTIKICTNLTSWHVKKRFSDFEKLNTELSDKISPLPKLPRKTFFNMSSKTITERMITLEDYLNQLLSKQNLLSFPNIMQFIEREKELFMLLHKTPTHVEIQGNTSPRLMKTKSFVDFIQQKKGNLLESRMDNNIFSTNQKNENETLELINNFLRDLEKKEEDKCSNINKFWVYITKKWPFFTKEVIMKLFYGDGYRLKGLLFHCGKITENSLGSQSCLDLVNKLIRYDYNPDCEKFLAVLKMGRLESIRKMRLESHLKSSKNSVRQNCFNIIKEVLNKERGLDLNKILDDETAESKFNNWIDFKEVL